MAHIPHPENQRIARLERHALGTIPSPFRLARAYGEIVPEFEMRLVNPAMLWTGSRSLLPGLLGLAALTAASCGGKISRETRAEIFAVDGTVSISSSATPEGRVVTAAAFLAAGESLRTGAGSSASVLLLPGALLHLGPESAIRIKELGLTKKGDATDEAMSRMIQLELLAGTADFVVQFEPAADAWNVATAFGSISTRTRGGTCRLQLLPHGLRLVVLRGKFAFRSKEGPETEIEAGFARNFPADSEPHPVETQAATQHDVEQLLKMEQNLLNGERTKRKTAFPWRQL